MCSIDTRRQQTGNNDFIRRHIHRQPLLPNGLDSFVELVVPELQKRGLYRREYRGSTLREHLGLQRPERR